MNKKINTLTGINETLAKVENLFDLYKIIEQISLHEFDKQCREQAMEDITQKSFKLIRNYEEAIFISHAFEINAGALSFLCRYIEDMHHNPTMQSCERFLEQAPCNMPDSLLFKAYIRMTAWRHDININTTECHCPSHLFKHIHQQMEKEGIADELDKFMRCAIQIGIPPDNSGRTIVPPSSIKDILRLVKASPKMQDIFSTRIKPCSCLLCKIIEQNDKGIASQSQILLKHLWQQDKLMHTHNYIYLKASQQEIKNAIDSLKLSPKFYEIFKEAHTFGSHNICNHVELPIKHVTISRQVADMLSRKMAKQNNDDGNDDGIAIEDPLYKGCIRDCVTECPLMDDIQSSGKIPKEKMN